MISITKKKRGKTAIARIIPFSGTPINGVIHARTFVHRRIYMPTENRRAPVNVH